MNPLIYEEGGLSVTAVVLADAGDATPRVKDLDLAEWLGYERVRDIREVINRNLVEIERFGVCRTVRQTSGSLGGRPAEEFYLTEEQSLLVCALSRTPKAADVRYTLIKAFMAWRGGHATAVTSYGQQIDQQLAENSRQLGALMAITSSIATQTALIQGDVRTLKTDVIRLDKKFEDHLAKKRRAPAKGHKAEMAQCVVEHFSSKCPCCSQVRIADESGPLPAFTVDHWNGSHNARPTDMWPVCQSCNSRLDKEPGFKNDHASEFQTFQKRLNSTNSQASLFFVN